MIVPSFLMCIRPVELEKFFPQKEHLNVFGVAVDYLPDFLRFSLGLAQHQNVVETDGTLDITCDNSTLVSSFQNSNSYLYNFAGYSSPADYLSDFSWNQLVV